MRMVVVPAWSNDEARPYARMAWTGIERSADEPHSGACTGDDARYQAAATRPFTHLNHSLTAPTPPATGIRGNRNGSSAGPAQPRRVVVALP